MKFIAGLPCLDFVNTVGGWQQGRVIDDKLETYPDLARWAKLADMQIATPARPNQREAAKVLTRARALRYALHRILNNAIENRPPTRADLAVLSAELARAREQQELAAEHGRFLWKWDETPALDAVLWRVSQSAAGLLTSPDLARLRRCAGQNCGWMFLDTTRNRSRHWCDMKDCGNLAKVRRFRERLSRG